MTKRGEKEKKALDRFRYGATVSNMCCLGFRDKNEVQEILPKIANVIPNEKENDFPDFLSEGCFLEHFQITSGSDTRKGADAIKDAKQYEDTIKKMKKRIYEDPSIEGPIYGAHILSPNVRHSEKNLEKSFFKHFDDHLDHLEKSQVKNDQIGVFLIEYDDARLMSFVRQGNENGQPHDEYIFHYNINVLKYLRQHKEKIQYVIFLKSMGTIEVISLSEIDMLIEKAEAIDHYAYEMSIWRSDYLFNPNNLI